MSARSPRMAARTLGLTAACAVALTGCITPFGGEEPTSTTSTSTQTTTPETRAGRQLSDDEAAAVLPTRPASAKDVPLDTSTRERTTDPQECIDVLRSGETYDALSTTKAGDAYRGWAESGSDPVTYNIRIRSYTEPVTPDLLDRAGSALGGCDAFSLMGTDDNGPFDLRVLAEPRTTSSLGEQNFGLRLISFNTVRGKSQRVYLDYVIVRVGHNLIEVGDVHQDETKSLEPLETYAQQILDDLEQES